MQKDNVESGLYLVQAINISGITTDEIKETLPIIVHYVNGILEEYYTEIKVYRGENYLDEEFLKSDCMLYTDCRVPFKSVSRDYVINQIKFQSNIVTKKIIPEIVKFAELTKSTKEELKKEKTNIKY